MADVTRRTPVRCSVFGKFRSKTPSSCPFPCSTTALAARSNPKSLLGRPSSPSPAALLNLYNPLPSLQFSLDRKSYSSPATNKNNSGSVGRFQNPPPRQACMCAPTTHPGSFRCKLHKGGTNASPSVSSGTNVGNNSNRLILRRVALYKSLVRIRAVETNSLAKRAQPTTAIWPSHFLQIPRERAESRPSRLSIMSKA